MPRFLGRQPFTMEEACANGDFELVEESFASVRLSSDAAIPLEARIMPGAMEVIQRSACIVAEHGHTAIFSFLLDKGTPIKTSVASAAFVGNKGELCQALLDHGWGHYPEKSIICLFSVDAAKRHVAYYNTEAY